MALPPLDYTAPLARPSGGGLYAAATLIDRPDPSRLSGGVAIWPTNCDPAFGAWPADPCADTAGLTKSGDRSAPTDPFEPVVVWGYDECDPTETDDAVIERAEHNLVLGEQITVEAALAARLLADTAPTAVHDVVAAVSALEAALTRRALTGVIHASPEVAAYAAHFGLIVRSGSALRTPLGHTWSFGGGYAEADGVESTTLFATGTVTVWRDAPSSRTTLDARHNRRAAVAERTIVAGYECAVGAVNVGGAEPGPLGTYPSPETFPGATTFPEGA